jgi:hypothetical protein
VTLREAPACYQTISSSLRICTTKQQQISNMALAIQTTEEITTATATPDSVAVTFTQQDSPLLRLPGELRNRIYHEIFQSVFDKLEKGKGIGHHYNPKGLRPLLAGLIACRQIHQEAMPILFRAYVAGLRWRLRNGDWVPNFFTRTILLCQSIRRYAPRSHFSISIQSNGQRSPKIGPEQAKAFTEELARQLQQPATLSFQHPSFITCPVCGSVPGPAFNDFYPGAAQDVHWKLDESYLYVRGSISGFHFTHEWEDVSLMGLSHLLIEGCLAQLDWDALTPIGNDERSSYWLELGRAKATKTPTTV